MQGGGDGGDGGGIPYRGVEALVYGVRSGVGGGVGVVVCGK
jgi:hypothetical protein